MENKDIGSGTFLRIFFCNYFMKTGEKGYCLFNQFKSNATALRLPAPPL